VAREWSGAATQWRRSGDGATTGRRRKIVSDRERIELSGCRTTMDARCQALVDDVVGLCDRAIVRAWGAWGAWGAWRRSGPRMAVGAQSTRRHLTVSPVRCFADMSGATAATSALLRSASLRDVSVPVLTPRAATARPSPRCPPSTLSAASSTSSSKVSSNSVPRLLSRPLPSPRSSSSSPRLQSRPSNPASAGAVPRPPNPRRSAWPRPRRRSSMRCKADMTSWWLTTRWIRRRRS
jgi:hypothetical protein